MARIRLGDKFSRFKTLSRLSCNDRDQQQVTDESIRDTLLDLKLCHHDCIGDGYTG